MRKTDFFTKKRTWALITLLVLILNMFSPYGILINISNAASPIEDNLPYFELYLHSVDASGDYDDWDDDTYYYYYDYDPDTDTPETYSGTKIVTMDISIKNGTTVTGLNAGNIKLKYDSSIMTPIVEVNTGTNKKPVWELQLPDTMEDWAADGIYFDTSPATGIDTGACTFRIDGATTETMADETIIATVTFMLAEGKSITDITEDVFTVSDVDDIMLAWDGGADYVNGSDYLLFSGFSAGEKKVDSIAIETMPSKTQYYIGETLDYTDGELKITYDDGTDETMTIADAITNGIVTADSTVATNSKKVTLTCDTKTVDFEYYVLDSISVSNNLTKMNYEHGDTIDFAGGELLATYINSAGETSTATLNIADEIAAGTLLADKNTADVDNSTVTFTYYDSKTASMTLTVTDPIASISITTAPSTLTYNDGDTISLAGGIITPITKSGKAGTPVATDATSVTASTTTASIAQATTKWIISGGDGLEAGSQTITLTYEGKTADFVITVNDTVSSVTVTTQPTAVNKIGTDAAALDFTGLIATVQTTGGGTFTVGPNSLVIDTSLYNANSLSLQSLPVKYGAVNSTNDAEITLSNYITGISVNFTDTEFDYNTPLSTVLASGTYTENYADGTSSSPKAITSDMVSGYNATPSAELFAADHTYGETLTIKLSTSSNPFDQLPATATQAITIKDVVDSISIKNNPSKVVYNYGDVFSSNGGQININYKSGNTTTVSMGNIAVSLTETDGSTINMSPAASEFVNGKVTKAIKVTYTDNGKTFDTSFNITIKDEISSIAITTNPTLTFEHGDTFNTDGGKLTVTYASTITEIIDLDDATSITETDDSTINMSPEVSEYVDNSLTKTIKVTHGGKETTYNITIINTIDGIAIATSPKTEYNLNESTTNVGGTLTVTRKAGNTETVDILDSMVTDLDTTVVGTGKTATVTYTEDGITKTTTYTYNVNDNVASIEITAPTKTTYNHGESLDLAGGTITVKTASGASKTVTMLESMITEADGSAVNMSPDATAFGTNTTLNKTFTITYTEGGVTETISYPITIVNDVRSIAMHTTPKTEYNVNDTLDLTVDGTNYGEILVYRAVGDPEAIKLDDSRVSVTGFNSSVEVTNLPLTVTFKENGISQTTSYNVNVKDSVKSIKIVSTPKTQYKYNEELDLSTLQIEVEKGSATSTIPVTADMVSGYEKTDLGDQVVTITYGGQTTTFTVNVKDYVTGITINPSTITGEYNDTLESLINDNNITYTVTYAKGGAKSPVALTKDMVAGYSSTSIVAQNLTVTYTDADTDSYTKGTDFTADLTVTLSDVVDSITITAPTKTTYNHGETLDLAGGTITVKTASGASKTVTMLESMITEADGSAVNMSPDATAFGTNTTLNKTFTITYTEGGVTETISYPITIVNDVRSIAMHTTPKTSYNVNEALDVTGGEILVTRATGTPEVISITDSMVSGFSSNTENTSLPLTVSYTENGITKTTTYDVSVVDTVTSIDVQNAPTVVKYGESLDLTGVTIDIVKGSGTTSTSVTSSMISGFDSNTVGTQTVTVTYGGQTDTFVVEVQDYVTGITVNPSSVTGEYGDTLTDIINDNGITYTVTYAKGGATSPEALTDDMVTGYSSTSITAQNLTVTYTDADTDSYTNGDSFTATLNVTLSDVVDSIAVTAPTKTTYNHGESLDLAGGTITVTTASGASKNVTMLESMITEADGSAVNMSPTADDFGTNTILNKTLTITYTEGGVTETVSYPITIVNDVRSIAMHTTPKTSYNVNEALDVTGGEILVTRATGTPEVISITDSMVSGFSSNTENTSLPLTVSYTENGITKTTTYDVSVVDTVTSIDVQNAPTVVKYGESLDLTGVTIDIVKGSGTTSTSVTSSMISGFDSNTVGTQTVTVTYGGQTDTFVVEVQDYVTGITVNPSSVTGEYGDTLTDIINDNGITYTVTYAKGGATSPEALTDDMVTGYSSTSITAQNLTVTYTDADTDSYTNGDSFTATLNVTLSDVVDSIAVTAPTKTTYNHGESLDLAGGTITVTTASGASKNVTMLESMITEADGSAVNMSPTADDFGTNTILNKTLTITYTEGGVTETVSYPITIVNDVKSIAMHTTPKTSYNVNDTLDLTVDGTNYGEILVTRAVGEPETISLNDSKVEVTGFDSTVENTSLPLTVTFTENKISQTTTYNISVKDSVKSITLGTSPKTEYKYGEDLDVSAGTIVVEKGSETTTIPITEDMVSGYDKETLGDQTITITYGGQTDTFVVNVKDYVTGITVNPSSVTGEYGDTLTDIINDNSITYTVTYAKGGAKSPEALTDDMVTGYDSTSIEVQNLTVTYTDADTDSYTNGDTFTANLSVTLVDEITGIAITSNPSKVDYTYRESLDLTGGIITVTRKSGKTQDITFDEAGVTLTKTDGTALDLNNVTFDSNHKTTETIQVNYEGQKATFDITITNEITGIVMENTPKTNYKVNENLDLTTDGTTLGTILVTRQNGETESIKLDDANVQVTGFNSTKENTNLQLTVSYTENSVTKTTSYTVSVIDTVANVEIETTPKTDYKYGESLDVSTGTLKITRDSGDEIIPITSNMVTEVDGTPFDSTKLGTRDLNVTYGGKTMTYEITVSDYVKGIILTAPTKLTYEYGEALDLTGGNIQKIMASGAQTSPVALSDSSVSISGYKPAQEGAQTITVTYEGHTETFGVMVEDNIQSIAISTLPTKTQYKYGENLSVVGGKITATRSSGKTETIDITSSMVTGFDPNTLGAQELTVTYKGKTDTYNVNVEDYVTDISIVKPDKLVYKIGESINLTGGQVNLTMASGKATSPVAMTDANVTITGFNTTSVGAKTITVNYKGFTETFGITVVDPLSGIILKTLPNKLDYLYGESLDLTGATLEVTKESGDAEIINVTKDMVSGYNSKRLGAQTLTVTYEGFTEQFIVNVEDYVSSLKVTKPSKVEYEYGESLDLTGGKVSIVMASGKINETAEMTASMISGFNTKQEGTQTIKVEYKGLKGNFQVKVVDKIKGISINTEPNKTNYNYGESLDLTGATINVVKSSGITTIPVTLDMVSGYDATTPGSQIITVTYGGFTAKFVVSVNEQEVIVTPEDTEEPEVPEESNNVTKRPIKGHVTEEVQETEVVEQEEKQEETPVESSVTEEKEEPTTVISEEKNDVKETKDNKVIAGITGLIGLLFIFLLIFFRRNVKVYVEEDKEFVLGGLDKIKKKNPKLDIDKYLDEDTYPNRVKIRLNDSISEKLDGKEIEIKHRGKTIKHKVKYNDEPYEFILE